MSADKRITKKQMKEDKLVTSFFKATEYVQNNQKPFLIGGAVFAVLILTIVFIRWQNTQNYTDSMALYSRANLSMDMGMGEDAIADLKTIVNDYSGSEVASHACFTLANVLYQDSNYEEAIIYFEKIVTDYNKDKSMAASSSAGIGACFEQQANFAEAAKNYKNAANTDLNPIFAPSYLLKAGYNFAQAGDNDSAKLCFEQIAADYPQATEAQEAKRTLAELN